MRYQIREPERSAEGRDFGCGRLGSDQGQLQLITGPWPGTYPTSLQLKQGQGNTPPVLTFKVMAKKNGAFPSYKMMTPYENAVGSMSKDEYVLDELAQQGLYFENPGQGVELGGDSWFLSVITPSDLVSSNEAMLGFKLIRQCAMGRDAHHVQRAGRYHAGVIEAIL